MSEDELIQEAEDLKKEINELKQKLNQEEKQESGTQETKKSSSEQKRKKSKEKAAAQSRPANPDKKGNFDPDRLSLSKDEIIAFCDSVIEKWNDDPMKNSQQIFAMNAVRTSVLWTDEQILKDIWGEILRWGFELMFKNALAQAREGNESWAEVFDKIKKDL